MNLLKVLRLGGWSLILSRTIDGSIKLTIFVYRQNLNSIVFLPVAYVEIASIYSNISKFLLGVCVQLLIPISKLVCQLIVLQPAVRVRQSADLSHALHCCQRPYANWPSILQVLYYNNTINSCCSVEITPFALNHIHFVAYLADLSHRSRRKIDC